MGDAVQPSTQDFGHHCTGEDGHRNNAREHGFVRDADPQDDGGKQQPEAEDEQQQGNVAHRIDVDGRKPCSHAFPKVAGYSEDRAEEKAQDDGYGCDEQRHSQALEQEHQYF
ncbi:hypothetical protein SDC9_202150 [bioreactor metagenome]|uniref:Uncharacterized protein n=1 Tax=bioreactor metagenome TaxID=1076179 RepID=A0A645IUB1_9ZZZZ